MKKLLCTLLAALMPAGIFAGCPSKDTAPAASSDKPAAAGDAAPAELKGELVFAIWDNNLMTYIEENDMVGKFQEVYPKASIEVEKVKDDSEYWNTMKMRASANQLPDVMFNKPFTLSRFQGYLLDFCYTYTAPAMPDLKSEVTYTVTDDCRIKTDVRYFGMPGRPELPLFGLRFATPLPVEQTAWVGLSGETYPDRKKGGVFGTHTEAPHIPAYLVPQECGCHMDTHELTLRLSGHCLTIGRDADPFAFSAIPYTPHQLSEARHADELPAPCRRLS